MADIAHVGRAGIARGQLFQVDEFAAECRGVALERRSHRPIGLEVEIIALAPAQFEPAARRQCTRFEAGLHARLQQRQFGRIDRAHVEPAGGALGHDVRCQASFSDDAVNAFGVADVLAQLRDRLIGRDHRIERVQPAIGHGGGMRRAAVIDRLHFADRDARHGDEIHVGGMDHHRRIDAFEGALARHQFLAAETFLRRRAEIAHAAGQAAVEFRQGQRRAQSGRRDDVVSAGMTDAGQRVVFGQDGDGRSALLAELGGVGGVESERSALIGDPMGFDRCTQSIGRLEFLQRQLRLAMDRVAQREQLVAHGIDRAGDVLFQRFQRHEDACLIFCRYNRQSHPPLRRSPRLNRKMQ